MTFEDAGPRMTACELKIQSLEGQITHLEKQLKAQRETTDYYQKMLEDAGITGREGKELMQINTIVMHTHECDICRKELTGGSEIRSDSGWVVTRVEPFEGREASRSSGRGPAIEVIDVCDTCKDDFDTLRDLGNLVLRKCNSAEELGKGT